MKKQFLSIILIFVGGYAYSQAYEWVKQIGGSGFASGSSIVIDNSGNIYTTGSFAGTLDFDPGAVINNKTAVGASDIYITKSDPNGNLIWVKTMGSVNNEGGASIAVDGDGNVYTVGSFVGSIDFDPGQDVYTLSGNNCIFISKLDTSGNFVWAKKIDGVYYTYVFSVALDDSGNVYATGHFEGGADFDPGIETFDIYCPGGYNIFILKLDNDGNFMWAQGLGGLSNAQGESILVDSNGDVYVAGHFYYTVDFNPGIETYNLTSAGNSDIFILKLDTDGNFIWAKQMGGPGSDGIASIRIDDSNSMYAVGNFEGIADFDPGEDSNTLVTNGYSDIFISKLTTDGNFIWAKSVGGSDSDAGSSIAVDPIGNIFVSGTFKAVADLDPGGATHNLIALADFSAFILKLDPSGDFLWCGQFGEYGIFNATLTTDAVGAIYSTGYFSSTTDFDPGTKSSALTSLGTNDAFILKLDNIVTALNESGIDVGIDVFPNPTFDVLIIKAENLSRNLPYRIIDKSGKQILKGILENKLTPIDIGNFAPGSYLIQFDYLRNEVLKIEKI